LYFLRAGWPTGAWRWPNCPQKQATVPFERCRLRAHRCKLLQRSRVHKTANVLNKLPKSQQSVECLIKDRDALLAFYDFPAEHWNARGQKGTRRPASLSKSRIVANREVEITRVPEALFGKRRYPNRCAAAIHRRWRLRHYYRGRLFKPDLEPAHQSPN
jgi:hypothetical protein